MKHEFMEHPGPLVMLHGGAGAADPKGARAKQAAMSLTRIARRAFRALVAGDDPAEVAAFCCWQMERDPLFNAGLGSALQTDGAVRMSAALMLGSKQSFSGVVNASFLEHPIELGLALQRRSARVLGPPGVDLLARELGLSVTLPLTRARSEAWLERLRQHDYRPLATPVARKHASGSDTVGCLVRTARGALVAAASTGGRGFEYPGRVSDTCTVAGTYASKYAAVVATGVGEEIVDDALASRLETRVRDGATVIEASERCLREARQLQRAYGWLALSPRHWCVSHTTRSMPYVVIGQGARGGTVLSTSRVDGERRPRAARRAPRNS